MPFQLLRETIQFQIRSSCYDLNLINTNLKNKSFNPQKPKKYSNLNRLFL
jgi:hypothetical protein